MSEQAAGRLSRQPASALKRAVYQNRAISKQGLLERLFTAVFDNLVYPQIWEDPEVDMRALDIRPGDHVVTIASGGCNVLSYLTADPGRITAVDLNPAHLALTKLKLAASRHLPNHEDFHRFFGDAQSPFNEALYDQCLAPHLDEQTLSYWSGRGLFLSRRITLFSRNIYRHGMLGRFIHVAHLAARLYGVNPADLMEAKSIAGQRRFFDARLAPLFDKKLVRWLTSSPVSLYGLGIPPAQYEALAEGRHMADVLRERVETLACGHALKENYFARQAFGRSYDAHEADAALPPYLDPANWDVIGSRAERVTAVNKSVTDVLADAMPGSVDRVVLLDAQDWMSDDQLNALWTAITRAAAPGARVIFRTAASCSLLEGRVDPATLSRWSYHRETSRELSGQDRSAIYGAFHLYVLDEK